MERYDDLCPRCYRKNNKECRICITQDALRAVRDALREAKLDNNSLANRIVESWFERGGRFEVKEEGQ